jgi:lysozyme family protein
MTTDQILADVLAREGGYVDHPLDRGSCTNFGITVHALADWRGRTVTCEDVRALTRDEALAIYREVYVRRPGFEGVFNGRLRALLVDFGVHSGPRVAIRALQTAIGAKADGILGPQTIAALNAADAAGIYRMVLQARMSYIAGILQRDPSQRVFAAGWLRRLAEFV